MSEKGSSWKDILSQIDAPLKFFALALLIIESFIAVLSIRASPELLFYLLIFGSALFVFVILMVGLILFQRPHILLLLDLVQHGKAKKVKNLEKLDEKIHNLQELEKTSDGEVNNKIKKLKTTEEKNQNNSK